MKLTVEDGANLKKFLGSQKKTEQILNCVLSYSNQN